MLECPLETRGYIPVFSGQNSNLVHTSEFHVVKPHSHSRNVVLFIIANVDGHHRSPAPPRTIRRTNGKAKKAVRRAWTKDDVRTMKTMAKAKSGVAKIAKVLKRTPGATTVMAAKLGISLSMRD
jgi:hypothetical protein